MIVIASVIIIVIWREPHRCCHQIIRIPSARQNSIRNSLSQDLRNWDASTQLFNWLFRSLSHWADFIYSFVNEQRSVKTGHLQRLSHKDLNIIQLCKMNNDECQWMLLNVQHKKTSLAASSSTDLIVDEPARLVDNIQCIYRWHLSSCNLPPNTQISISPYATLPYCQTQSLQIWIVQTVSTLISRILVACIHKCWTTCNMYETFRMCMQIESPAKQSRAPKRLS